MATATTAVSSASSTTALFPPWNTGGSRRILLLSFLRCPPSVAPSLRRLEHLRRAGNGRALIGGTERQPVGGISVRPVGHLSHGRASCRGHCPGAAARLGPARCGRVR